MPASITIAFVASSPKVIGSNMEMPASGPIPRDVDTDADYRAVLAESEQKARA